MFLATSVIVIAQAVHGYVCTGSGVVSSACVYLCVSHCIVDLTRRCKLLSFCLLYLLFCYC